jgi:hypothetical protein
MTVIRATDNKRGRAEPGKRGAEFDKTWLARRLRWPEAPWSAETAATAVEFALAAPLLLGLLMPVADLGLAYSQQIQVQQAAQAGAQYASLHPWNSNSITAITSAVTSATRLSALTASPAPYQTCGCPDGRKIAAATCNSLCVDGQSAGYYVIVNARLPYSPILPYSLLGDSVILTAQATVRGK